VGGPGSSGPPGPGGIPVGTRDCEAATKGICHVTVAPRTRVPELCPALPGELKLFKAVSDEECGGHSPPGVPAPLPELQTPEPGQLPGLSADHLFHWYIENLVTIAVRMGVATHVGRVREENEDAVLAGPPVFAVADGMGGQTGGELAASLATAELARFRHAREVSAPLVIEAIRAANDRIREFARQDASHEGMGTTVTGIALTRQGSLDAVLVFNVGDSRTYRCRGRRLAQVSSDHSVVAELMRDGRLTDEQARSHAHRHVVTRALGALDDVQIDMWFLTPRVGDRYLLCSDGLTSELSEEAIGQALDPASAPQEIAELLVEMALLGGGRDNISVVVIDVENTDTDTVTVETEVDEETDPRFGSSAGTQPPAPTPKVDRPPAGIITGVPPSPSKASASPLPAVQSAVPQEDSPRR
jgi:serine/threonine protein phosphatase PrpC